MLEVVQKVSQPQAKEHDFNELVEKFRKRFPPEFHGMEDPTDADEWVVQMEKIYEVFKCTGRQQVQLAAHMFRGVAERWWKMVKNPYETVDDETAWKTFTKQFQKKFVPKHYREQKMTQFEQLVHGVLSVQEYEIAFTDLSQFEEALIRPKSKRVRRFIKGLRPDIKMQVQGSKSTDYDEVVKEVYWAEEALKDV